MASQRWSQAAIWSPRVLFLVLLAGCSSGDNPPPPTGGGGGTPQPTGQPGRFNRPVTAIISAPDGSGDIYVAGTFTTYNDRPVGSVVRIRPNGTLNETFTLAASLNAPPGSGKTVVSIAPVDDGSGDIYVGELISPSNNLQENLGRIWKVNADGTIDQSFPQGEVIDATPEGFNFLTSRIHTIVPVGDGSGRAYVCGVFDRYNGTAVQEGIVRVTPTGTVDPTFQHAENSPTHTVVAADDGSGDLYVLSYNIRDNRDEGSSFLYRLNGDGSHDPAFNTFTALTGGSGPVLGEMFAIAPVGDGSGDLFVSGLFIFSPSGPPDDPNAIRDIARVNPDGTLDRTSPRPITPGAPMVRAVDGTRDWLFGGSPLMRFKADTTVDPAFLVGSLVESPGEFSPAIGLLPVSDGSGDWYVGGNIATYNGVAVGHIVRLNGNGTLDGR